VTGGAAASAYTVKLEVFEGPLDLLLHLIRREEMDIYDIPIARITQQYLEYLQSLTSIDLDTASQFLVMAVTLMDIKSRMLLPRPKAEEFIDDEAQADPREELVTRLIEYRRYKEAALRLEGLARAARRSHSRFGGPAGPPAPPPTLASAARSSPAPTPPTAVIDPACLLEALREVLREVDKRPPETIVRETVTVGDKIAEIVPLLVRAGDTGLDFTALLRRSRSRRAAVVTFLALLELLRQGRVRFVQEKPFGPVTVYALAGIEGWGWPGRD